VSTTPDPARLREIFDRIEPIIEQRWGIPVRITDVPNPFTGDLDGESILVDHDLEIEDALFILVHLFGHTVQWNVSPEARAIGSVRRDRWTDEELVTLASYEREACRYSLQLLHDAGVFDLDHWLACFAACDGAYLHHFYKTGEKRPFRSFWRDDAKPLAPLPIPDFSPVRWISRYDGTVV
jgi:hypothetical protein